MIPSKRLALELEALQRKLGIPCVFSLRDLAKAYARPFEKPLDTLGRLLLHEAMIDGEGSHLEAADRLEESPRVINYMLRQHGALKRDLAVEIAATSQTDGTEETASAPPARHWTPARRERHEQQRRERAEQQLQAAAL